jgi:nucleotide-binding universal stress UspA family protein
MNTNNITKILVPIDFSETSVNALDTAIGMAVRQNAELELLNVIESSKIYGVENVEHSNVQAISRSLLESFTESITRYHKIKCFYHVENGTVADIISSFAVQSKASIIVMGTHGSSGMRELFMGSNAYATIKKAPCPVLTVPNTGKWKSFNKILFPVRPVENAIDKYDFVRNIIKKNNAQFIVLGFKNTQDSGDLKLVDSCIENLKVKLEEDQISAAVNYYTGDDFITSFWQFQKRHEADLIVLTANIDSSFKNYFVGPFIQQIVNHAKVPVLSIKPVYGQVETNEDLKQMAEWAAKYGSSDPFAPVYL